MNTKRIKIMLTLVKVLLDCLVVYFSFMLAYWIRFSSGMIAVTKGFPSMDRYSEAMPIVILIFLMSFHWNRLYVSNRIFYKTDEFINIIKASVLAVIIITAATFIYRQYSYSRLVLGFALTMNVCLIFVSRRLLRLLKEKILLPFSGKVGILVIGGKKVRDTLSKNIAKHIEFDIYFSPVIDLEDVLGHIDGKNVQEIVLADSSVDRNLALKLINICEQRDIEFKMVPDMLELKMGEMSFDKYFGIPVLELKHPLFEPSNYYLKRITDIVIAMSVLLVLSPFLILLMILIKIDSKGPVIYSHLRKGYRGRCFSFYKFRSMVRDADVQLKEIIKFNEREGPVFKMKMDPRVTRIGKIIRRYSIDELPQLFNILKGDMSLVGPRPQVLWEAEAYNEEAKRRLNILPGITGLWQVSGRSELSFEEMIKLDLYYLENWTLGYDMKILLRTIPVVLLKKGAY
ncbi:MAG: sugar transferase [Elusimicrobia bacterium]|nr:sugar transferase [Elusimicrobiota bacterium]